MIGTNHPHNHPLVIHWVVIRTFSCFHAQFTEAFLLVTFHIFLHEYAYVVVVFCTASPAIQLRFHSQK